ncbi:MAG: MBL fold metallo-hydrolase [Gemmatimonadales bacterium]
MRLTLLGTGTSFGVPQIGCRCEVCRSSDPRDTRHRAAAVLTVGDRTLLIDTPPELRVALLAAGVGHVDGVLFTHEHADHVGGIDDLRIFSLRARAPLPVYANAGTAAFLRTSYRYIFDDGVVPVPGTSKPRLELREIAAGAPFAAAGIEVLPIGFEHGSLEVLGFRVGPMAYVTDVKAVPAAALDRLRGVDTLVLNALWWRQHPTHLSIPEAIEAARRIGARRTVLTHLTHETGHATLAEALPDGIEPGFDGLILEVPQ